MAEAQTSATEESPKSDLQKEIGPVDADPSPEVSRKRQSLSDLFTIVRFLFLAALVYIY